MSAKIKLFAFALVLIAGFSAFRLLTTLKNGGVSKSVLGLAAKESTPLPTPDDDADHDGLSNQEESYWNTDFQNPDSDGDGFKDGEEVLTGHDPRKAGPNDWLSGFGSNSKNLTTKTSDLLVAGLYSGALKAGSPNLDQSLQDIVTQISDESLSNAISADASSFEIATIPDSPENVHGYIAEMSPIVKTLYDEIPTLLVVLNTMQDIDTSSGKENFIEKDDEAVARFQSYIERLKGIRVTTNFSVQHRQLIVTLLNLNKSLGLLKNFGDLVQLSAALISVQQNFAVNLPNILDSTVTAFSQIK